jgi:zinc/manganese transport system permease protein
VLGVRVRERDAVVGVVMAFGLGLGVLFLTLYPRYATEAFAILFGTITGVSRGDVLLLIGIGILTLAALAVVYRPLSFATVDPDVAEARGVPVGALAIAFLLIMAAAVAEAVQVVGVLLILTLLITPGATAERLTARPGRATAYSVALALFSILGGILLALVTNLPVSVYVTSLSFAGYLLARLVVGPKLLAREGRSSTASA